MEARKRLYKAGPRDNPTLSERVKDNKKLRQFKRFDKFAAARQIPVDGSPTPMKAGPKPPRKSEQVRKLKAYRLERNTKKLKTIQEQRSPFIVAVPSGRWLEKKERAPAFRFGLSDTPVKNALMNERVLKNTTIKKLIAGSTAKKENPVPQMKTPVKSLAVKSKKKILGELNAVIVPQNNVPIISPTDSELNSTFEILPSMEEAEIIKPLAPIEEKPLAHSKPRKDRANRKQPEAGNKQNKLKILKETKAFPQYGDAVEVAKPKAKIAKETTATPVPNARLRRSKSMSEIKRDISKAKAPKTFTPPAKPAKEVGPVQPKKTISKPKKPALKPEVSKKIAAMVKAHAPKVVIAKPVVRKPTAPKTVITNKQMNDENSPMTVAPEMLEDNHLVTPEKKKIVHSSTFNVHKTSMDTQIAFVMMRMKEILSNKEMFFDLLNEDQQTFVNQTTQQANLVISEKLSKFEIFLNKFEEEQSTDNPKRLTEDDVENYWYLIYDEIDNLKNDFDKIQEMKKTAFAVTASQKKRRTRRTLVAEEGTPKRSRRIAENVETPKHNASCYGCVTLPAKINTPKSTQKRRTTAKKSVAFNSTPETPKRSESRRSSKRYKATPKRNLIQTEALDIVEDEFDMGDLM